MKSILNPQFVLLQSILNSEHILRFSGLHNLVDSYHFLCSVLKVRNFQLRSTFAFWDLIFVDLRTFTPSATLVLFIDCYIAMFVLYTSYIEDL